MGATIAACASAGRWAEVLQLLQGERRATRSSASSQATQQFSDIAHMDRTREQEQERLDDIWRRFGAWQGGGENALDEALRAEAQLVQCVDAWRRAMNVMAQLCRSTRELQASSDEVTSSPATVARSDLVGISEAVVQCGKAGNWEEALQLLQPLVAEAQRENVSGVNIDARAP